MKHLPNVLLILALAATIILAALVVLQDRTADRLAADLERGMREQAESCRQANVNRRADNARGLVLREFLSTAEQARRASRTPADVAAADQYARLRDRVELVPYRDCDGDGSADVPAR